MITITLDFPDKYIRFIAEKYGNCAYVTNIT